MIMNDINTMYDMLYQEDVFVTQIDMVRDIKDLSVFIMPPAHPFVWEKCAYILFDKTDQELEPYLESLVDWIQDLNWPGALTISERLQIMDGRILLRPFLNCYKRTSARPNELKQAAYFWSELLVNETFRNGLPENVRMYLEKRGKV